MIVQFIDEQPRRVRSRAHLHGVAGGSEHVLRGEVPAGVGRAARDAVMIPILVAIWTANYRVYGAHKLWKAARRAGHEIGRDQVARLMRHGRHQGVSRKRRLRTTRPDPTAPRPADLVQTRLHRRATERVVGHRPDLRADMGGGRVRVFHRRRVLPDDRRLARRVAHAHRDGPRRARDGTLVTRHPTRRTAVSLRRRAAVHEHPLRRTTRRTRRGPVDRHGR